MTRLAKLAEQTIPSCVCTLGLVLTIGGCSSDGTKTGNGVQMEFVATGQALNASDAGASDGLLVTDQQGTTFTIDEAVLVVSELEVRAKGQDLCSLDMPESVVCTNGRWRLRELMEFDLLPAQSNESALGFELPAVVYDRVEVRTEALDKDSALGPASFYVSGLVTFDGETNRFVLSLKRNATLRFDNLDGVDVESGQWLSAQIDLTAFFATLPLSDCAASGDVVFQDGVWLFTEDSKCGAIEQSFVEELGKSTRLDKAQR